VLESANGVRFFIKFECKRSITIKLVGINYSVLAVICDAINNCTGSCCIGKISVHDKIIMENARNEKNWST